jgi:thiamine-phosphate pyrophosphorylase
MIALPRLYPILDAGLFPDADVMLTAAAELAAAGCTLIQYRNKSGNARVMLEHARELKKHFPAQPSARRSELPPFENHPSTSLRAGSGWGTLNRSFSQGQNPHPVAKGATRVGQPIIENSVRLIMNDRADLALMAEFDGVHVGQDDLSPESVRTIIGPDRWLGVSTHNPEQLATADQTSADYLAIGPVFSTTSKDKPDPMVGLEGVRRARRLTSKPLVAIGGITRQNAASVIEAGADSVAVISDLLREPGKSAEEFFRILG